MPTSSRARRELVLETARRNPEFARRLLDDVPSDVRALLLAELARPKPATTTLLGPGIRKCRPRGAAGGLHAPPVPYRVDVS